MSTRILIAVLVLAASAFGQNTADTPATQATHYPILIHADLPLYPPLAWTAHISGTVEIQVTVEKGSVVDAQVKSSSTKNQLLSLRSVENVKTWQFRSEDRTTFLVKYVYRIKGEQTPLPENPKVELDLPRFVTVTAKPFKLGCSDCGAQNSGEAVYSYAYDRFGNRWKQTLTVQGRVLAIVEMYLGGGLGPQSDEFVFGIESTGSHGKQVAPIKVMYAY